MKNSPQFLCKLSDIDDPASKAFQIKIGRVKADIFIVRKGEQVYAYQNICPHAQAPLEWNKDAFLDDKKENIVCALHGAIFTIEEGSCTDGPCKGESLKSINIELLDGGIYVS